MKATRIPESELVLNTDGSVYHLNLKAEHIANTIFLVGDQDRVKTISNHFDSIQTVIKNREFITHTGRVGQYELTALSTGIGTDNIDIVLNELYAAVNINPETRTPNPKQVSLNLIRLGTTGALHKDLNVGDIICSTHGLGLDGQMYFYNYVLSPEEHDLQTAFKQQIEWPNMLATPYFTTASPALANRFKHLKRGITASGSGFYGPQGRDIRLLKHVVPVQERVQQFAHNNHRITNFDMETSALYGLGKLFNFNCLTLNVVVANRATGAFAKQHAPLIDKLIKAALDEIIG